MTPSSSATYSGPSVQDALSKAAAELGVSLDDLQHEVLLGSDAEGHVLIRASAVQRGPSPVLGFVTEVVAAVGYPAEVKGEQSGDVLRIQVLGEGALQMVAAEPRVEMALTHLARRVADRSDARTKVDVEVLGEEEDRDEIVRRHARLAIEQSRSFGRKVVLPPMNPYERRLVHLEVRENSELQTESVGSGRDRRILVVPPEPTEDATPDGEAADPNPTAQPEDEVAPAEGSAAPETEPADPQPED